MRAVIQLGLVALILHAMVRVGPVYVRHRQFQTQLLEMARKSFNLSEGQVIAETLSLAESLDVPLTPAGIQVRRVPRHTYIDATYTANLEIVPIVTYPWTSTVSVDGYVVRPPTASDYLPHIP